MDLLEPSLALSEERGDLLDGPRDGVLVILLLVSKPREQVLARHLTQLFNCAGSQQTAQGDGRRHGRVEGGALLDSIDITSRFKSCTVTTQTGGIE